jgi:mannose/fructose/N-acetylgalactosamine-specific phosphotransferase system component IIC
MATLVSIVGAVGTVFSGGSLPDAAAAAAIVFGVADLYVLWWAPALSYWKSRLAIQSIKQETAEAIERLTLAC